MKIVVKVNDTKVVEYNSELFQEHINEIPIRAMCEVGAICATKEEIVLRSYADLSKLNNLIVSYLA